MKPLGPVIAALLFTALSALPVGCKGDGRSGAIPQNPSDAGGRVPPEPPLNGPPLPPVRDVGASREATADISDAPSLNFCAEATDCIQVEYYAPVASPSDCYCPVCPGDYGRRPPVNRAVHDANLRSWMMFCSDWADGGRCGLRFCPATPMPVCTDAGTCGFGDFMFPMIPVIDGGGGRG